MNNSPFDRMRRITRKNIGTGAISGVSSKFGRVTGKTQEVRIQAKFTLANRPTPVIHGLGKVPTSWRVVGNTIQTAGTPGQVYSGHPLVADRNRIVLYCTAVSTITLVIS